jgi:DedD protein
LNESSFKQRLIGAAVLIALAVLFLPLILDGKKAQYFEEDLIPQRPVDSKMADLAASLEANSNIQTNQTTPTDSILTPQNNPSNDKMELTGNETAFMVQVGSFADPTNAEKLVGRLKSRQLKAFVGREKVFRDGKQLSQVFIGPMLRKSEAEEVLDKLKDNSELKASIVEFDPVKH